MNHVPRTAFAWFVAASVFVSAAAAQEGTTLRVGQTISGTLDSGTEHTYLLELRAETFVYGNVNQLTVDVVVTVVGPDGEEVAEFDSPARGPETFTFTTESEGTYVVRIAPFEEQQGDYEVTVQKAEAVARDPDDRIDQLMTAFSGRDTPGVVVGVMDEGETVFERAYGMADLSFGVEYEVSTPTNIGSVTKQFTAMSILLLQNDGLLSLDDEIRRHIPELPDFGQPVTIKNLLNHTSGFREIYNFLPMTGLQGEDHIRREQAIEIVQRQPELQAAPDTEYNYNNTGFILLSMVVERLSGQTFPEFARDRIFRPLGMNDTRVKYDQGEIIPGASTPYVPDEGGGWRSARDLSASAGAGGIYTTWRDMRKWMLNYRDATVGGPEAIELLTTRNILASGDTTGYALGLGVGQRRGQSRYTHTGGDTAHRTYFAYFPELEAGIFLSSNNATFNFSSVNEIEELFFGDRLDPEESEDEASAEGSMSAERMDSIAGDWILEGPGLPIEFTAEEDGLFAEPRGQTRIRMEIVDDSTVAYSDAGITVVFQFEDDGSVDTATFTQGQSFPLRRFERTAMGPETLVRLAGRYFSRELDLWLGVRVEDGSLVLERFGADPLELSHGEGLSFSGAFPFVTVEFQQAANGEITGLLAGNGRTKGVLFRRQ